MKKRKWAAIVCGVGCLLSLLFFVFSKQRSISVGHFSVTVLDAYTLSPVENAFVYLPESGLNARTDKNGEATLTGIPCVIEQIEAYNMPKKQYGETTILVYADSYLPFALFHAHVYPGSVRNGPIIYLFPNHTEEGLHVVSMIESPPEKWVEDLLDLHAPKDDF